MSGGKVIRGEDWGKKVFGRGKDLRGRGGFLGSYGLR